MEHEKYEEYNVLPQFQGWVVLIVLSLFLIGTGMLTHFIVRDVPRWWDFGQMPDIPGQSPFSTIEPSKHISPPSQLTPLPAITGKSIGNDSAAVTGGMR